MANTLLLNIGCIKKGKDNFKIWTKRIVLPPPKCGDIAGETAFEVCERNFDGLMETRFHQQILRHRNSKKLVLFSREKQI